MNKKILVAIALTLALVMSLSSCSFLSNLWESYVSPIFKGPTIELTDAPLTAEKIVDFTQEHIQVPRHVLLRHVDVVSAIQEIIFEANAAVTDIEK